MSENKSSFKAAAIFLVLCAATIALVLSLGSCEVASPPISQSGVDKTGTPMLVTTYTYRNDEELNAAHERIRAQYAKPGPITVTPLVDGFAVWTVASDWCDIHIVPPRDVRDSKRLKALGHEQTHCLYGNFHN